MPDRFRSVAEDDAMQRKAEHRPDANHVDMLLPAGAAISGHDVKVLAQRRNIPLINAAAAGVCLRAGIEVKDRSILDHARKFAQHSLIDICRESIEVDRHELCQLTDPSAIVQRATSTGTATAIFTTIVNASMMAAWDEETDSTQGWTRERDVKNFTEILPVGISVDAVLRRLPRGQEAAHATISDWSAPYSLVRLARQFEVDDQDVIDDRIDALTSLPEAFGRSARRAKPDLVYSLILANPVLTQDGKPTFSTDHANYGTSATALTETTLQTAIAALENQTDPRTKDLIPYGLRASYLVVPPDLKVTALDLARKITIPGNDDDQERLIVVSDARLGTAGVVDPMAGTKRKGTATNYLLAARAGRTIEVAYLDSQNRKPRLRDFPLGPGKFGIGWDICFDIGATIVDYPGLYWATGAA